MLLLLESKYQKKLDLFKIENHIIKRVEINLKNKRKKKKTKKKSKLSHMKQKMLRPSLFTRKEKHLLIIIVPELLL